MSEPVRLTPAEHAARRAAADAAACGGFLMPPEIRTERLVLAPFKLYELDVYARLFGDADTTRHIGGPTDRAGAFDRMARFSGNWRLYGFGAYTLSDRDGCILGYAGLWFPHDRPEIEIAYGLLPAARGKGYVHEAVTAIRNTAEACGAPGLVSYIDPDNAASQKVAKAAGAVLEARIDFGEYVADAWRYPLTPRAPQFSADDLIIDASVMPLAIRTPRLSLCQWRPEHYPRFAAHLADPETMRFIGGLKSAFLASRIFSGAAGQWHLRGYGMYALEHEGEFVGSVGLYHPENWPQLELAYNLTADARGKGFATEAVSAVRDVAAAQGIRRLVSYIDPDNAASLAVARRVGARQVGETRFTGTRDLIFEHTLPDVGAGTGPTVRELLPA